MVNGSALSRKVGRVELPGAALVAVAVGWLTVAGMIAIVIRMQVPTPVELLRDVAGQRALWISANVVLIVQQAVLIVGVPLLLGLVGPAAAPLLRGLVAIAEGALVASGVFHGVFGAHLASKVTDAPLAEAVALDAELVHALGDTCWFVGVGALTAATALVSIAVRRRHVLFAGVGLASVVFNLLQFGWFFDHVFGVFAGPGTALQAAWFGIAGLVGSRVIDGRVGPIDV